MNAKEKQAYEQSKARIERLSRTPRGRLELLRTESPNRWRENAKARLQNPLSYPFQRMLNYWTCDETNISGWRERGTSFDISREFSLCRDMPQGWYADEFEDELFTGKVWQLPATKHNRKYVAGFADGSGYVRLCASNRKLDIFDCPKDAARAGDRLAEIMSEHARDYSAADSLEQCAIGEAEQAFSEAREALAALREQRALGSVGARVCKMLGEDFRNAHNAAREALRKLPEARRAMQYAQEQSNRYAGIKS